MNTFSLSIAPRQRSVLVSSSGGSTRFGWRLPAYQINTAAPAYITQQRRLLSYSLPLAMNVVCLPLSAFAESPEATLSVDLYLNKLLIATEEVTLQPTAGSTTELFYVGEAGTSFQNPFSLPHPETLEVGFHGLCPPTTGFGAIVTVESNYLLVEKNTPTPGNGSFYISEEPAA